MLARWSVVMGLAENIRAKVHQGVLPPGMPAKIAVLFGDGRACSACDEPQLKAQTRYEFELPGFGTFSFHLGCFGLYTGELCRRGWLRGQPSNRVIPISEAAIRAQLRGLLEGGILPRGSPKAVVAGQSEGRRRCAGCSVHFQPGDVEYEITTDQTVNLVLHRRCMELWTELVIDPSRPPIHGGQDPAASPASIRTRLLDLIDRGVLPVVMPRRLFVGQCLETHPCTACGMDIETGAREYEWTNPANLMVFFHLRCAEIYLTLNDGQGSD
jgi:hypothetical protein